MSEGVQTRPVNGADGVVEVVLDNPPLNLLTMQLRAELADALDRAAATDDVRAVVLRGAARGFSAGSDVREFPEDEDDGLARAREEHACVRAIEELPIPVIAALHGHVLGGGLEIALACDIRVADETARLGLPEVGLGVFPSGGGATRMTRIVGASKAKELMLTGTVLLAADAAELGIVDHVVAESAATTKACELAAAIAARPARAVRAIKQAVDAACTPMITAGAEAEQALIAELFTSQDAREGVVAFREKREPVFRHA